MGIQLAERNQSLESKVYSKFAEDSRTPGLLWAVGATIVLVGAELLDRTYCFITGKKYCSRLYDID